MRHISSFKIFESSGYNSSDYEKMTGNSAISGVTQWIYSFFKDLDARFKELGKTFTDNSFKDIHGKPIDSGIGWAVGLAGSLASDVAETVFKPSDFFKKTDGTSLLSKELTPQKDSDVKLEHQRLLSNNFIENDLSNINSDSDMKKYILNSYKKSGVRRGEKPWFDKVMDTNAASWYSKKNGVIPKLGDVSKLTELGENGAEAGGIEELLASLAPAL